MPTTRNYRNTYRHTTTTRRRTNTTWRTNQPTTYWCNATAYNQPRTECQWRMGSYRNVYTQFTGGGTKTPFSPTTANKWIKFVQQGCRIYKFNNNEFTRYFGQQWNTGTPNTCFRWMRQRYGQGIKAVTRGKSNTWLVAATPSVTARPFQNYTWR